MFSTLKDLPWQTLLSFLMAILAALMISNVPYPAFPAVGYKTARQRIGSVVVLATIVGMIVLKKEFFFPAAVLYVLYGVLKYFLLGLLGKPGTPDQIYWDGEKERAPVSASGTSRPSRPSAPSAPPPPPADGVLVEDDGGVDRIAQRDERDRAQRRRRRRRGGRGGGNRPDRPDRGNNPGGSSPSSSEPPSEPNQ